MRDDGNMVTLQDVWANLSENNIFERLSTLAQTVTILVYQSFLLFWSSDWKQEIIKNLDIVISMIEQLKSDILNGKIEDPKVTQYRFLLENDVVDESMQLTGPELDTVVEPETVSEPEPEDSNESSVNDLNLVSSDAPRRKKKSPRKSSKG